MRLYVSTLLNKYLLTLVASEAQKQQPLYVKKT